MLKKTITFSDLDGEPVTQTFYFNLSKGELAEWGIEGGKDFEEHLQDIIKKEDNKEIMKTFKDILFRSIGRRGEDNITFHKSPEISLQFLQSDAYSEMLVELISSSTFAVDFINGIMPKDILAKMEEQKVQAPDLSKVGQPEKPKVSLEELQAGIAAREQA